MRKIHRNHAIKGDASPLPVTSTTDTNWRNTTLIFFSSISRHLAQREHCSVPLGFAVPSASTGKYFA